MAWATRRCTTPPSCTSRWSSPSSSPSCNSATAPRATYLATSLVATLQLIAAASVYIYGSAMLPGGLDRALGRLLRTLDNETELTYVTTGERIPGTWLWRVWTNRRAKPSRH